MGALSFFSSAFSVLILHFLGHGPQITIMPCTDETQVVPFLTFVEYVEKTAIP